MGGKFTPGCLLSRFQAPSCEKHIEAPGSRRDAQSAHFEAFRVQTFPHVEAVYADAFCLTGNPEDAVDLVEAAYVRAYLCYEQFRRRRVPEDLEIGSTLAWLYSNMHAAFCNSILAQTRLGETPDGD